MGFTLAKAILKIGCGNHACILGLCGPLGSGKTKFSQGLAKGLGVRQTISSPTFVILKRYPLAVSGSFKNFYHIDCYRLDSASDLAGLGIKEIFKDPTNIVVVEWPEIFSKKMTKKILIINFEAIGKNSRRISFGL